jgi:gas vesicle protein
MSYWDEENTVGVSCLSFIVGSVLGASIALLYAPQSGEVTRQEMREKTERTIIKAHRLEDELKGTISQLIENVKLKVNQLIEDGKEIAEDKKEEILAAIDAGKKALEKERAKLEKDKQAV